MKTGGMTSAFGGNLAIMDVYAAQKMFGRGRTFDRVDIGAEARPYGRASRRASCRRRSAADFKSSRPPDAAGSSKPCSSAYSMMVNVSSLFALFIGMFIIYNSFAIAVTQRRSEIGILRALGATRAQIRWLFLGESAVTGVVGSIGGLLFGVLIAQAIAASIGNLISDVYGVAQRADEVASNPTLLLTALAIGVATSIVAALIPAGNAARVDPVQALQKGKYQVLSPAESRWRIGLAAIGGLASVACLMFSQIRSAFYVGYALAVTVALLLSPILLSGARATVAAAAQGNSTGRRRSGGRQPDSIAATDVGERGGRDAVARVGRCVRRDGARELRLDHRVDGHCAQSGSLRQSVAEHRHPDDPVP